MNDVKMRGNRMVKSLMGLLLILAIGGLCWRLLLSERLLRQQMVQVLDYQREPDTRGSWLDAQTLLLVTGKSETSQNHLLDVPAHWKGKVQRLNIQSGNRTPDLGLTRMLNSLHAEPMTCTVAPGSQWLLWTEPIPQITIQTQLCPLSMASEVMLGRQINSRTNTGSIRINGYIIKVRKRRTLTYSTYRIYMSMMYICPRKSRNYPFTPRRPAL